MCTKLAQGELKNCNCRMARFCKRRQQLETEETRDAVFFGRDTIKINSLVPVVPPVNFEYSTDLRIRTENGYTF
jgi:hypothetical protein